MFRTVQLSILAALSAILVQAAPAKSGSASWESWRGPNHDGISTESNWDPGKLKSPKVLWKQSVGNGWSIVAVKGSDLFTMGNTDGKNDTVYCLNAETGKEVWKKTYPCPAGNFPGPRSTPVIDGSSVYTFSRNGDAICWSAKTGKKVWHKNLMREFGAKNLKWGLSASPRVVGDLVIYNANQHGVALKKSSGSTAWSSPKGIGSYAVPVLYEHKNKQALAIFGQKAVYGVDLKSGRKLWSFPWETAYDVNAPDPIISNGKIFICSGYKTGAAVVDFSRGSAKKVWQNKDMSAQFSTPVLIDGNIYGIHGNAGRGELQCLDFKTGSKKWGQKTGFGALMAADGKLIILTEKGKLIIAKAQPSGYSEIASAQAMKPKGKGKCWVMPVLCNGIIYCRDSSGQLVAIDVSK